MAVVHTHLYANAINTVRDNPTLYRLTPFWTWLFDGLRECTPWHVPIFFLLTGALLLQANRVVTPRRCVQRYTLRILLALVVFGVPFAMVEVLFADQAFNLQGVGRALLNVLNDNGWGHMWYLYALCGIYLLLPVFKRFTDAASRREQRYVLAVLFIYDFCFPAVDALVGTHIGFAAPITYPIFYFLAGHYLAEDIPRLLKKRWLCGTVFAMLTVVAFLFHDTLLTAVIGYSGPMTVAMVVCLYGLLRGIRVPERFREALWRADRLCFGVYLVHPLFLNIVYKVFKIIPQSFTGCPPMIAVLYLGFVAVAFLASWCMARIPPLKKYIL